MATRTSCGSDGGGTVVADMDGTWWWCLKHSRAEDYENTDSPDRLGPFASREEADHALTTIKEREERYAREEAERD